MPFTPNYGIPYQGLGDAPHGPDLGEAGFLATDLAIKGVADDLTALTTTVTGISADLDTRPRGFVARDAAPGNSGVIGTTETVIRVCNNVTFKTGRAYKVSFGRLVNAASAGIAVLFRARQTSATGTNYGILSRFTPSVAGVDVHAQGSGYLVRTAGTDLTTTIVLTMQTGTSTAIHIGTVTEPRYLLVEDVGRAADYAAMAFAIP